MPFSHSYDSQPQHSWPGQGKEEPGEDEDEMSILDEKILDADTPNLSISTDVRHNSIGHSSMIASSSRTMWPEQAQQGVHHGPPPHVHRPSQSIFENHHTHFQSLEGSQPQQFHNGIGGQWAAINGSGNCTPTPSYTPIQQDFDQTTLAQHRPSGSGFEHHPFQMQSAFGLPSAVPMSPQSSQGWMSATSSDMAETHSRLLRSPTFQPGSPRSQLKRDGIRKKNARFEIPAERNLHTIDGLIKHYSEQGDEAQIKELKQQKRLLRNRQAALDSRQRKKQHTEELEKEKEKTDQYVKELEDDVEYQKVRLNELIQEQAQWRDTHMQMQQIIVSLRMERDENIRQHTIESGDLRRKNNILREHLEQLEQEHMALANSHQQFSDFSHFDNVPIDGNANWNEFHMSDDMKMDHSETFAHPKSQSEFSNPATVKADTTLATKADYPFSWNTFYMCLLFGAFIASNTTSTTSSTSKLPPPSVTIPPLSEEYRAESANVLRAVLASAPASDDPTHAELVNSIAAQQGNGPSRPHAATISAAEMAHITLAPSQHHDSLTTLHASLATPSRHQEELQAFSLTPAQYASLTGMAAPHSHHEPDPAHHFLNLDDPTQNHNPIPSIPNFDAQQSHLPSHQSQSHPHPQPKHQTPLQKAFAALKENQDHVDRTLMPNAWNRGAMMWEQVPEKVVRDFKRMVEEVGGGEGV